MIKGIREKIRMSFMLLGVFLILYAAAWAFVNRTTGQQFYAGFGLFYRGSSGGIDSVHAGGDAATGIIVSADGISAAITSAGIVNGTIATADIATGAITTGLIFDGTIVTADIAASQITTGLILDATITSADVAAGNFTLGLRKANDPPANANYGGQVFLGSGGITITDNDTGFTFAMTAGGFSYVRAWGASTSTATDSVAIYSASSNGGATATNWLITSWTAATGGAPNKIAFTLDTTRVMQEIYKVVKDSTCVSMPLMLVGQPAIRVGTDDSISINYPISGDSVDSYFHHANIGGIGQNDQYDTIAFVYQAPATTTKIDSIVILIKTSSTDNTTSGITLTGLKRTNFGSRATIQAGTPWTSGTSNIWIYKSYTYATIGTITGGDYVIIWVVVRLDYGASADHSQPVVWANVVI